MNYEIDNLVLDFARRTRKNLEFIEAHSGDADRQVYAFTQLINSLLGLLVFPKENFFRSIPETPLSELVAAGWPDIKPVQGRLKEDNLRQLVRNLRNGVAHFNLEFMTNPRTNYLVCASGIPGGTIQPGNQRSPGKQNSLPTN